MSSRFVRLCLLVACLSTSGCNFGIAALIAVFATAGGSTRNVGVAKPTISGVSPATAPEGGGTTITITGTNFRSPLIVAIGGTYATGVVVVSPTSVTAILPAGAPGPAEVAVTNAEGGIATLAGGFTYFDVPASVVVGAIPTVQSGNIVVSFVLTDARAENHAVTLEIDTGGGFQSVPSALVVSGELDSVPASVAGVPHSFTLDSQGLVPNRNAANVRIRLTPVDLLSHQKGTPGVSNIFSILNNRTPALDLVTPLSDSNHIPLNYVVTDPDLEDLVQVTALRWLELRTGASGDVTVASGQGLGRVPFSPSGASVVTVWNSLADLGYGNDRLVQVTVTVSDGDTTITETTAPFSVSNGPLADQVSNLAIQLDGFAVGDVNGDGAADLIGCFCGNPAAGGTVAVLLNKGRSFNGPALVSPPNLPGAFPTPSPDPTNPFFSALPHPTEAALLDTNGDGALDLVVASSLFAPNTFFALASHVPTVLAQAGADAPNGFANVIAHQMSLRALGSKAGLDVANGTWETTQAPITRAAPHVFFAGSSQFPPVATGDPGTDNVGWFPQALVAADLDPPGAPGAGSTDLVILEGVNQLTRALTVGDVRGCVVIRQVDPRTGSLGPTCYLDPTDMGVLPTHVAVADVLSSSRATLGFPATVGAKDIVVANAGDNSLTFYYQYAPAAWPSPGAPTFTSFRFPLTAIIPGLPPGDMWALAIGDLNGDGANDLVVIGQLSRMALVFIYDPSGPASLGPSTGGLFPYRLASVLALPGIACGRPAIQDVSNDGRAEIIVPCQTTNQIVVFLNRGLDASGNPLFDPIPFASGFQPIAVAVTDLNADRRPDVVVANHSTQDFSVYYQVTPGTLGGRYLPIATGASPLVAVAGDLTGDGSSEIAVAVEDGVWVFARDPVALLAPVARYDTTHPAPGVTASLPALIAIGPTRKGGGNDIVCAQEFVIDAQGLHGGFEVIPGTPLGPSVAYVQTTAQSAVGVAVGDLDGDGIPDVVVASYSGDLTIFYGLGGGQFRTAVLSIGIPRAVKIVDLDGDGHLDLVISRQNGLTILYGTPAGLGTTPVEIDTTGVLDPVQFEIGDVNSDGRLDIVAAGFLTNSGAGVFYQLSPRTFTYSALPGGGTVAGIAIGDLDGDGRNDVAMTRWADDVVAIFYQDPKKQGAVDALQAPVTYATGSGPFGCVILDVNGDGKNDVVVTVRGANALNIFLQR